MICQREDIKDIIEYGQMTRKFLATAAKTADHNLIGRDPQGLHEDIHGCCYIPDSSSETNCRSVTNDCN